MSSTGTDESELPLRARVLLAVCKSDLLEGRGTPMVVGCMDEVVWNHYDDETLDRLWGEMKAHVDPGGDYYEYREVMVSLSGGAARWVFDPPYIPAEIQADDSVTGGNA